ncbi:class II fructose-bisphosphate aldolase, partial [Klebsiella pneumoniae]
SAQIREILISESAWEEMTCLFAPSLGISKINIHTELCQAAMAAVQENQNQPFLHVEREVRKAVKVRAMEKIKLFGSDGKAE